MSEKPSKWRVAVLTNSVHVYDQYAMFVCNCEKKEQARQIVREHNAMARVKEIADTCHPNSCRMNQGNRSIVIKASKCICLLKPLLDELEKCDE